MLSKNYVENLYERFGHIKWAGPPLSYSDLVYVPGSHAELHPMWVTTSYNDGCSVDINAAIMCETKAVLMHFCAHVYKDLSIEK